jgi:apolipoprotein N-acyltransferase
MGLNIISWRYLLLRFEQAVLERGQITLRCFWLGFLCAALSGVFLGLAFPLTNIFPLAWCAFVPLLIMQRGLSTARMWFFAFIAGLSFWLVHASWMHVFHTYALFSAIPALAVYFSLPFLFLSAWQRVSRDRFPYLDPLFFSLFWIGVEYFRSTGFLGYSWGVLGYSQTPFLPVLQIADIAGVWAVSFLVIFANAVFAYLLRNELLRRKRILLSSLLVFLGFTLIYGGVRLSEKPTGPEYRVQLVQAFVDPALDWVSDRFSLTISDANRITMDKIEEMTVRAGQREGDLIVWSETLSQPAGMYYYKHFMRAPEDHKHRQTAEWFIGMAARAGKPVLLTAPHREYVQEPSDAGFAVLRGHSYNAAFLVTPNTNVIDSYYKINLVPFGEWFPYGKQFPWLARILEETMASNFTPGTRYTVFEESGVFFSVVICFEDIFGELCRQFIRRGADFLINTTNDYWSKSIQSQEQHAVMAILRAVENRRYLVRAANTGVTCNIDAWGRMESRLDNHVEDILDANVFLMRGYGETIYTKHGDYLGIAGAYFCGIASVTGIFLLIYSILCPLWRRLAGLRSALRKPAQGRR